MSIELKGLHAVGWVKSAHGIRGELFLALAAGQADWLDNIEVVYLLPKGKAQSADLLIVENPDLREHKNGLILKTPLINDRNRAEELKGASVYIQSEDLEAEEGDHIFLKQLLNFDVVDADNKLIGQIRDFSSNGAQDLLVVKIGSSKDALIPLVEEFIVDVDFSAKVLKMNLPPGLIEEQ